MGASATGSASLRPAAETPTPGDLESPPLGAALPSASVAQAPAGTPASIRPASLSGATSLGAESPFFAAAGPLDAEDEYGNIYVVWQELYDSDYEDVYVDVFCTQAAGTYCSGKTTGIWEGATQIDATYYEEGNGDLGPDIAVTPTGTVCVSWGSSYYDDVWLECYDDGAWTGDSFFEATDTYEITPSVAFDEGGSAIFVIPYPSAADALEVCKVTVGATLTASSCTDYTVGDLDIYEIEWDFIDDYTISCLQTSATTCAIFYNDAISATDEGVSVIQSTNDFTSITYGPATISSETWSTTWKGGWFGGHSVVDVLNGASACSTSSADCGLAFAYDSGDANPNKYILDYAYSTNGWDGSWAVGNAPSSTESISVTGISIEGTDSPIVTWNTSDTMYISGSAALAPTSSAAWGTDWTVSCTDAYQCMGGVATVPTSGNYNLGSNIPWRADVVYSSADLTYYQYFYGPAITTPTTSSAVLDLGQSTTLATSIVSVVPSPNGFTIAATGYTWGGLPTGCASTAISFSCDPTGTGTFSVTVYATDTGGFTSATMGPVTVTVNSALAAGAITPASPAIDNGQSITLTSHPSGGTAPYSYQWYTGAACTTPIVGATSSTYTDNPALTTTFYVKVTDSASTPSSACSAGDTVTVNPALSAGSPTPASPTIDDGQSITLTANPSGGTPAYSYQWYSSASGSGGCSGAAGPATSTDLVSPVVSTYYCYVVGDSSVGTPAASAASGWDLVTVDEALVAGAISPSSPTIDDGQSITLNSAASGGTPAYSYQWYTGAACNTAIGGATGSTYAASPASTTTYTYKVTDSAYSPESVCSPSDTVAVNAALAAGAITPAAPGIDTGQSVTLTAHPSGGTSPYSYQWYTGAGCATVIGGATASTYTASPGSTTTYSYIVTDSAYNPSSVCSAGDTVTVNVDPSAGAITPNAPTIDNGQSITLTSAASGGTAPLSYQWYTGAACGSAIGGATAATYAASPSSTTTYSYLVTDSSSGGPLSACSPTDTVTVNPTLVAGAITPASPTIDNGQSIVLTANPSGGTTPWYYQWYTGAACNTAIGGATASTYSANPSSTTTYSYKVTDSAYSPASACSAGDTVAVNPALSAGAISPASPTIDNGQSVVLTANPSGGTAPYSYQWYTGAGCSTSIGGATTSTYTASPVSTTSYSYKVTDSPTPGPTSACSPSDTVTVNPALAAGAITPSAPTIDDGQTITLTANPSGGTTPYTIDFYLGASCNTLIGAGNPLVAAPSSTTMFSYKVTDSAYSPSSVCSSGDTVTVNPALSAGAITPASPALDDGQSVTLTSAASGGTAPLAYQWYTGAACNTAIGGAISTTYLASPASTTTYSYKVTDSAYSPESVCSPGDTVTVNPVLAAGAVTPASPAIDVGQSVTLTANPTGGTTPYAYQWYTGAACNSAVGGATAATYAPSPGSTTTYSYRVTDSAYAPTTACSSGDTVTVNPDPIASPSANPNPTGTGTDTVFSGSFTGGTGPFAFAWRFADGAPTSHYQDPTHQFNVSGTYVVAFWVNDSVGVSSEGTVAVTVSSLAASGSTPTNPTDTGIAVVFTGGASGGTGGYTYAWKWGDGQTTPSYYADPTHVFNATGSFLVRLFVNDSSADDSQVTILMVINAHPTVAASASPNPTDVNYATSLLSGANGGTNPVYLWRCSDGFTSGLSDPTNTFGAAGAVTCWVWNNDTWFTSSSSVVVTINDAPAITSISATPTPTDVNYPVALSVTGSGGSGASSYAWHCTDGFQSAVQNPSHGFLSAGTFTCRAWYNDSITFATGTVAVAVNADPSVSAAAAPNPTDVGVSVALTAVGAGGTSAAYAWRCWGGFTSVLQDPTTSFASAGAPTCNVWFNDSYEHSEGSVGLTINADPAVGSAATPNPTEVGVPTALTAVGTGGTSATYAWRCWGGFTSVLQDPTVTFASAGTPSCTAWYNDTWLSSSHAFTITVAADPTITVSAPRYVMDAGQTLTVTATPASGTPPYVCQWYVNGSAVSASSCASYAFNPSGPGSWTVYATVTDSFNIVATSNTLTFSVGPALVVTATTPRLVGDLGQTFVFSGAVVGGSSPYTCQWYASGAPVGGATTCGSLSLTPGASGSVPVYLHVLDSAWGQSNSSTLTLTVNVDPTITLTLTTPGVDVGQTASVTGAVAGGTAPFSCRWYVNGTLQAGSSCAGTSYVTSHPGPLVINATLVDAVGWTTASGVVTVHVQPDPHVSLSPAASSVDAGQPVTFTPSMTGGTTPFTCQWFENSTVIAGATSCSSYIFTPARGGTYEISVHATDSATPGWVAVGFANVTAGPPLVTVLTPGTATRDVGVPVAFSVAASGGAAGGYTYSWWVNGVQAAGATSSYSYVPTSAGTFTVQSDVTDLNGNTVVASATVTVNPLPSLVISATSSEVNVGQTDTFGAMPSLGTTPYGPVRWFVGGVFAGTGSTFLFSEATPGTFDVNASFVDFDGVVASSSVVAVTVVELVLTGTAPSETEAGVATTLTVTASGGTTPYAYQWSVNGTAVTGATGLLFSWTPKFGGSYNLSVNVTDSGGLTEAWARTVFVLTAVEATLSLNLSSVEPGVPVELSASASGGLGPYVFTWVGLPSSCAPSPAGAASVACTPSTPGTYGISVDVVDSFDATGSSAPATLTVVPLPTVVLSSNTTSTSAGSLIGLSASVSGGTGPFGYAWTLNGSVPISANGDSTTFSPLGGGVYVFSVAVRDHFGKSALSNLVTVTVGPNPAFTIKSAPTSTGFPLWLLLVIVAAAVGAVLLLLVLRRRRRSPQPEPLEEYGAVGGGVVAAGAAVSAGSQAGEGPVDVGDVNAPSADEAYTAAPPSVVEVPRESPAPPEGTYGAPAPEPMPEEPSLTPAQEPATATAAAPAALSYISIAPVHPAATARGVGGGDVDVSDFPRCPNCGSPLPSARSECLVCASSKPETYRDPMTEPEEEATDTDRSADLPTASAPAPWEGLDLPEKRARPVPPPRATTPVAPAPTPSPPPAAPAVPSAVAVSPAAPAAPSAPPAAPAPPKPVVSEVRAAPPAPAPVVASAAPVAPTPVPSPAPSPPSAPAPVAQRERPRNCYVCGTSLDGASVCPTCGIDWSDRSG